MNLPLTHTATGWLDLIDAVYEETWDKSIGRFRSRYVFRGCYNAAADLSTRLMRFGGGHPELAKLEGYLLRDFRKYAQTELRADASVWNWLALAQHHGLPTRLLDWSFSPFIAMHFVTQNLEEADTDGVIWCVNHRASGDLVPASLRDAAGDDTNIFNPEMLEPAARTIEAFDALSVEPFVIFFEPPSLHQRIVNQFALFSVVSSPSLGLDELLAGHPDLVRRILVPAALKPEIRDKLDQAGINERMLYPGLDGVARWLGRYYRPISGRADFSHPRPNRP